MSDKNTASIESLLRYSLPLGASVVAGDPATRINWSVTIRAQPPAFPDIYGGELALVSMDVLRSFDDRLRLADVIRSLADINVNAVLATGVISQPSIDVANDCGTALVEVPESTSLTTVERAVNSLLLNQSARLTERAIEIQRQLTRLAAENRDLGSLLGVMARAIGKPIVIHDAAGVMISQIHPNAGRRVPRRRGALPLREFQSWLTNAAPAKQGMVSGSPLGFTAVLQVEKRVAGYLSLVDQTSELDEFKRLVLAYGADVCAIEMAKNRAIASAVEQARGDWIQMWLGGAPADDDSLRTRSRQAGFDPDASYILALFRAAGDPGRDAALESLISLARDDMSRRQVKGAVGQYVDAIVALYPLDAARTDSLAAMRQAIDGLREKLSARVAGGAVAAGISRPAVGLAQLRDAYPRSQRRRRHRARTGAGRRRDILRRPEAVSAAAGIERAQSRRP